MPWARLTLCASIAGCTGRIRISGRPYRSWTISSRIWTCSPEDRETLFAAFAENRANSDCMYNQPNEQNCGGEALARNFLYGQLFTGRVMKNACRVYSPEDVFGHPNQLSQIARKSGCIGVMWGKCINNFPPFFEHLALDGVSMPHQRGWATWDDAHYMGLSVVNCTIDQTPPTDWHATLLPKVQQATPGDIPAEIRRQCEEEGAHVPITSRDMALYHAATGMSRTNLKIGNRLGENVLIAAEKFATIANLLGAEYPDKALDKAWRQILCGQHHDSITGTHNEISYVDLMNSYREVLELGTDVLNRSLDFLGRAVDPAGADQPLVVFNSLAWERTDVIRTTVKPGGKKTFAIQDHRGKNVPFEVTRVEQQRSGGRDVGRGGLCGPQAAVFGLSGLPDRARDEALAGTEDGSDNRHRKRVFPSGSRSRAGRRHGAAVRQEGQA